MKTERKRRIEENRRAKKGNPDRLSMKRYRAIERKHDGSIPRNPNPRKTRRTK